MRNYISAVEQFIQSVQYEASTRLVRGQYEASTSLVRGQYESSTRLVRIQYEASTRLVRGQYESSTSLVGMRLQSSESKPCISVLFKVFEQVSECGPTQKVRGGLAGTYRQCNARYSAGCDTGITVNKAASQDSSGDDSAERVYNGDINPISDSGTDINPTSDSGTNISTTSNSGKHTNYY